MISDVADVVLFLVSDKSSYVTGASIAVTGMVFNNYSRARMGSESIVRGHEGERNNCFSKIQLVSQKYRE